MVRTHVMLHGEKQDSAALFTVSEDPCLCEICEGRYTVWQAHQDMVLKGLNERWSGFHPEWYATKDTYKEDAMRCYNLHRRPQDFCIDWKADYRRLTPESWPPEKSVYLCDFCPVAVTVKTAQRMKLGAYNRQPGEVD